MESDEISSSHKRLCARDGRFNPRVSTLKGERQDTSVPAYAQYDTSTRNTRLESRMVIRYVNTM